MLHCIPLSLNSLLPCIHLKLDVSDLIPKFPFLPVLSLLHDFKLPLGHESFLNLYVEGVLELLLFSDQDVKSRSCNVVVRGVQLLHR